MKKCVIGLLSAMVFSSSFVFATPTIPTPPPLTPNEIPVGEAISPMRKGQTAPFTGVLLSPEAVAKIVVEFDNRDEQIALEVNRARAKQQVEDQLKIDELNADIVHQKKIAAAESESLKKQLKIINDQLAKSEKSRNDTPLFVGLGALAGAAVAILSVVGVAAASR